MSTELHFTHEVVSKGDDETYETLVIAVDEGALTIRIADYQVILEIPAIGQLLSFIFRNINVFIRDM